MSGRRGRKLLEAKDFQSANAGAWSIAQTNPIPEFEVGLQVIWALRCSLPRPQERRTQNVKELRDGANAKPGIFLALHFILDILVLLLLVDSSPSGSPTSSCSSPLFYMSAGSLCVDFLFVCFELFTWSLLFCETYMQTI